MGFNSGLKGLNIRLHIFESHGDRAVHSHELQVDAENQVIKLWLYKFKSESVTQQMKFRETCEVNSSWSDLEEPILFHQSTPGTNRAHKTSTTIADGRGELTTQLPDGRSFFTKDN
jgi:hypothetical protein